MKEELELDIKTNGAKTIGQLKSELKDIKDQMVGLSGDEFLQAAKKAGELQHQLKQVNEAVSGASADFGDMLGNITKFGAGISGAFQAAQGAMNLFGAESEDVAKALEKMQSLMSLTQGLSSIDEGIKSFGKLKTVIGLNSKELGTFKKALIGTGLGALVVVLGSIIANWEEFTEEIGISEKQMNKLGETFGGVTNVILKSSGKIASAFAKIVKGDFSGAWDEIKSGWDFQAMYAEGVQKAITKREKEELEKRIKQYKDYVSKMEAQYDILRAKAEALIDNEISKNQELLRIEKERLNFYKEGTKEYYNILANIKKIQESLKVDTLKGDLSDIGQNLKTVQSELANVHLIQKQITSDEALKTYYQEMTTNTLGALQNMSYQLADVTAQFDQLSSGWTVGFETFGNLLGTTIESVQTFGDANATAGDKASAALAMAASAMQGIGSVLNSIASEQNKNTKEGFEKQKKLQIAAATMNMLGGIAAAWVSAMNPANAWMTLPGQIAMGTAQTAATAALGGMQIAKIKATSFEGGAGSGSARPAITPAAAITSSPVQYTQDIQHGQTIDALQDTRVFVTETDISSTQHKVEVAENESKF